MLNGKYNFKSQLAEWMITSAVVMFALQALAMFLAFGQSLVVWGLIVLLGGLGYILETSTNKK